MYSTSLSSFLDDAKNLLGSENVSELDGNLPNVSALERRIPAIVKPSTTNEVSSLVRAARKHGAKLSPLSSGKNWGYGSALPVEDGSVLVDLGRMDAVRQTSRLSSSLPVAVIEAGVTQLQLFEAIDPAGLFFNATGAGPETSVIGNSLERGFGYHGLRPDDVAGLEAVLGTGEIIRTGFWGLDNAAAALQYPSSTGPSLDGLFFQSNFGIVTAAAIRLQPKPPAHAAMMLAINDETDFPRYLDALAALRCRKVFSTIMHIGNRHRARATLGPVMFNELDEPADPRQRREQVEGLLDNLPYRAWSGVTAIQGTPSAIDEAFANASETMSGLATVERIDDDSLAATASGESLEAKVAAAAKSELLDLTRGVPVQSPLWSPYWALGEDFPERASSLDESNVGVLFCAPVFPLEGEAVSKGLEIVESTLDEHGFDPYITLNIANAGSVLCILNIVFDRRDRERCEVAHKTIDTLYRRLISSGHYPYRLGVQSMGLGKECLGESFSAAQSIKRALDPDGVIAPGRYGIG